jgi:hypothetical protein
MSQAQKKSLLATMSQGLIKKVACKNVASENKKVASSSCARASQQTSQVLKLQVPPKNLPQPPMPIPRNHYFYTRLFTQNSQRMKHKEARETTCWIRLLAAAEYLTEKQSESILYDAEEICKILAKIQLTLKSCNS